MMAMLCVSLLSACSALPRSTSPSETSSPEPSPSFPSPVLETLDQRVSYLSTTFAPPASPAPAVTENVAVADAESEIGAVRPTEVAATYVDVTAGDTPTRPTWIVSFVGEDICNVVSTVPGSTPSNDCAGNVTDVAVDASTGAIVGVYSNGSAADSHVPPAQKSEKDLLIGA